jgi:hypothetical protein
VDCALLHTLRVQSDNSSHLPVIFWPPLVQSLEGSLAFEQMLIRKSVAKVGPRVCLLNRDLLQWARNKGFHESRVSLSLNEPAILAEMSDESLD